MRPFLPGTRRPWLVAHRGASASHPENSAAAFEAALREPIDGIELDLQLSLDDVPVVYHDRTLRRIGGGGGRIEALTLEALARLDVGRWFDKRFEGERMLTLDEVLLRYGHRTTLLLEIKARKKASLGKRLRRLTEQTVAAINERGLEASVLLLCFDPLVLEMARELSPGLRTVLNLRDLPRLTTSSWAKLEPLFALSVDVRALTQRFAQEVHERGKPVLTYTCNTPRTSLRALRAEVDAIMTDRPDWLGPYVSQAGPKLGGIRTGAAS